MTTFRKCSNVSSGVNQSSFQKHSTAGQFFAPYHMVMIALSQDLMRSDITNVHTPKAASQNQAKPSICVILDTHRSRYILLLAFTVTATFIFVCKTLGIALYTRFQYPKAVESPGDSASFLSPQSHCHLNKQSFLYISRVMLLVYRKTNRQRLVVWNVC